MMELFPLLRYLDEHVVVAGFKFSLEIESLRGEKNVFFAENLNFMIFLVLEHFSFEFLFNLTPRKNIFSSFLDGATSCFDK